METNNASLITDEYLACGTSLAENEYTNNYEEEEKASSGINAAAITPDGTMHPKTANLLIHSNNIQSISDLRSMIVSDLLQDARSGGWTIFESPFEDFSSRGLVSSSDDKKSTRNTSRRFYKLPLVYCDQTASNRCLVGIERYITNICLPLYGNTHTNTSITGSQSTAFVAEARQIIAENTNSKITGKASLDVILFAGNGATSAVELLIDCLGLKHNNIHSSDGGYDKSKRPVIFVGPYEHHSNIIPWRETGCEIVMIPESCIVGGVDMEFLERTLQKSEYNNRIKMGTFTAASNVTGIVSSTHSIAKMLHQYNALCFIDYATAAPYIPIDMNPMDTNESIDAAFISPHKMIGGIGTPGILIVKKHLINQANAPSRSGGGTVFYVTSNHHRFLSNHIERYEGGTPNVVGIIRAGLVFLLKRQIEQKYKMIMEEQHHALQQQQQERIHNNEFFHDKIPNTIQEYEFVTHEKVITYLKHNAPNLILLGCDNNNFHKMDNDVKHLPIFSFLIKYQKRYLHYNYVCAILNDVFGIQSRGGCQCSGPYSQRLLGLNEWCNDTMCEIPNIRNKEIENALIKYKERAELLRPGYTRLSLPFKGMTTNMTEYVLNALVWVSKFGWALMCQYRCNHRTGEWRHSNRQGKPLGKEERRWLSHYNVLDNNSQSTSAGKHSQHDDTTTLYQLLQQTLTNADAILHHARSDQRSIVEASKMVDTDLILGSDDDSKLEELRWYVYPKDCAMQLLGASANHCLEAERCDPALGALDPNSDLKLKTEQEESAFISLRSDDQVVENSSEVMTTFDRKRKDPPRQENPLLSQQSTDEALPVPSINSAACLIDGKQCMTFESLCSIATSSSNEKKSSRDRSNWGQQNTILEGQYGKAEERNGTHESTGNQNPVDNTNDGVSKKRKFLHEKPPPKIMRFATQAIMQWEMIKEGDRLLLGLSGGKDSLTLLHCLLEFKRILPIRFELEVCTIDPMTPSFDPSPLIPYVEALGLKYHYIKDNIVERANNSGRDGKMVASLCAYCARMKRGNLYSCARTNNCNKLVLAQHLDDCAESFMMSVMHNGFLRTMKAHYAIDAGDLSVIRPLIYCRESLMTDFAKSKRLPVINENCPACFEEPKERARIKKLLSREETMHPNFYDSIKRSLIPLMHDDLTPILRGYTEEVVSKRRTHRKNPVQDVSAECDVAQSHLPLQNGNGSKKHGLPEKSTVSDAVASLQEFSEEELVIELARRKAKKAREMKSSCNENDLSYIPDPTGQVCSLNGGNGSIPCSELME